MDTWVWHRGRARQWEPVKRMQVEESHGYLEAILEEEESGVIGGEFIPV